MPYTLCPFFFFFFFSFSQLQSLVQSFHIMIIWSLRLAWLLWFILLTWKSVLCYLEASHLLLHLSIYIISLIIMSHFSREILNFLREKNLPYVFSVLSEFCILIVYDARFRNRSVKTNLHYIDPGVAKMNLYSLTLHEIKNFQAWHLTDQLYCFLWVCDIL